MVSSNVFSIRSVGEEEYMSVAPAAFLLAWFFFFFKFPTFHRQNSLRLTTSGVKMPEAGTGASIVHQLSQHMQILFCVSRVFSTFLSEYNMCVASRMVMFRESSFPGHWLPLTACRILPTILSFSLLFNLAHCQGNHEDAFGGRIMNFRDVAHDTIYYQYR